MATLIYVDADDLVSIRAALEHLQDVQANAAIDAHLNAAQLSPRECEVIRLDMQGLKRRVIAERLSVTEHTIERYWKQIYEKTGYATRQDVRTWMKTVAREAERNTGADAKAQLAELMREYGASGTQE